MKTNTKLFKEMQRTIIAVAIAMATIIGSVAPATQNVQAAVYREGNIEIVYNGDGELTKTLSTGQAANVSVDGGVMNIIVDGKSYGGTYPTACVGSFVIAEDDLLHTFWVTGEYLVYDLRENGLSIKAYKNSQQKYCSEDEVGAEQVFGTSVKNAELERKSPLMDNKYFYQYGKTLKQALMTRAEFTNIVDPQPEEPNQPTEPENPDKPTEPTQPDKPTEPTDPTIKVEEDDKIHTVIDINFWIEQFKEGTITWEQLKEIAYQYREETDSKVVVEEDEFYYYDEEGKLIHVKRTSTTTGNQTIVGSGTGTENTTGKADYEEKTETNGNINGTVDTDIHREITVTLPSELINAIANTAATTTSNTSLTKYPDRTVITKPDKNGWILIKFYQGGASPKQYVSHIKFHKKRGIMKFNGLTFKNIKDCGYIKGTTNVWFLERVKGKKYCKLWTLPRHAKKRNLKHRIKGKYVSVQKTPSWQMGAKATEKTGKIIDLEKKDKAFDKK